MRIQGKLKFGYYPLPESEAWRLKRFFKFPSEPCLALDPCSGTGAALKALATSGAVLRGVADQAMDVINLKISKVGGLTKARQIRDLCVSLGIAMTIEDTWGGDIITAAISPTARPRISFSPPRISTVT